MATYNGWTNYATWNVALWLDNDEYECNEHVLELAAEQIKSHISEMNPLADDMSVFADLLHSALDDVNWREIAQSYIDELDKSEFEEEDDNSCDQCVAMMINGVYCHETGCPNTNKVKVNGEWIDSEEEEVEA